MSETDINANNTAVVFLSIYRKVYHKFMFNHVQPDIKV